MYVKTMSHENSPKDSQSESSNSSPNAVYMLRSDKESGDLILFGASVTKHHRSATVRRASSASLRNKENFARSQDDINIPVVMPSNRYRRSLDSTYRQSLESISEYKTRNSFSTASLGPSSYRESLDSTCSDCTDYATRSTTEGKDDNKTFASPSSASYLSWIESVANATNTNTNNSNPAGDVVDVDNKVGEWNNFWLNYNNPNNRYLSSPYLCASNEDRTGDDISDCKSTCSTQREFNEKITSEHVVLSLEEAQEALHCSQRIADILQKALKRNDTDTEIFIERSRHDSYYSQQTISINEESMRDRTYSYAIDPQELQKQKSFLKPPPVTNQPSTNSCINALLNTGVADILKRVINKRREVITTDDGPSTARSSFSEWSTGAK